ncbi:MAG TPA: anaerobic ribonucleoside-triphosphate reductase activating protein [Deltaproteobacteria bacterium]|nr:anaerobic ribonucleoside-triphosphate reductase activating protein [Deltaproteobacteria bacterium]HPJ92446.1 anaerobic ribonucleoside-triphosphate reductase activating protein [Deltaproteobacteria bacterium]HPR50273.1 anaerobic ribonucleoside-triphosphate reductase activating protein [Deltaproteobacteria bacterium]
MKIGHIQKTSLIEYPGKISAIIFTLGCNFACPYCHNPELVDPKRFVQPLDQDEVIAFLKKRAGQLDAVVITGGEPMIHADLIEFMKTIKDMGYLIKLDTNGTSPDMLTKAIEGDIVDYVAMDIKAPLERYEMVTGTPVNTDAIKSSIDLIMNARLPYEFRTTLVRSLLNPEDILTIGRMIKGAHTYILQHFVPSKHLDNDFIHESSFTQEEVADLKRQLDTLVKTCIIR